MQSQGVLRFYLLHCHGTYIYVAKTTIPVAKAVYIRPTSISFLRICQSPATDVVVVACFRGVFFVSSLIAACSLGLCSLRKQFFYASRGFCPNGGKQRCGSFSSPSAPAHEFSLSRRFGHDCPVFFQGTFEFKSSLKKDRAVLSKTSGQRKLVCWC